MLQLITISRPRFWIYLLGPYLVGAVASASFSNHLSLIGLLLGGYFTLPANLMIYGINDIFDYETDRLNLKKQGYESLVPQAHHRNLWLWILGLNIPVLLLTIFLPMTATVSLMIFALLGIFYSAPPIRAKTKPFLDSTFNCLYILPGLVAYFVFGGSSLNWWLIIAAVAWAMAMHAYSAVPDIEADRAANMTTVATTLGKHTTLLVCLCLYLGAGLITAITLGAIGWLGVVVYGVLMLVSLKTQTHAQLLGVYKLFPYVNTLMGALLFLSLWL